MKDTAPRYLYQRDRSGCAFIGIIFAIAMALLFSSCRTITRVEKEYIAQHDTIAYAVTKRDSIYLHDSIYKEVTVRGDSVVVFVDRWHTAYRDRIVRDSIYISKTDTVYVEREKTIEREPSLLDRTRLWMGGVLIFFIMLLGGYFLSRYIMQRLRR